MDFLSATDPGEFPANTLTGVVFTILRILAYGAVGVVVVSAVTTCWCCIFECRRWKRPTPRTS